MNIIDEKWLDETWEKIDKKLSRIAVTKRGTLPYTTRDTNTYDDLNKTNPNWWTNGFWPGMMWLMYQGTKNEVYRETAENAELLLSAAMRNYDKLGHDVGFVYLLSSGANYRITGNRDSFTRTIYAAATLASRYKLSAGYIRAWRSKEVEGYAIIDTMMNLPLLYWASKETDDERFKEIAMSHADKTLKNHMRDDGSVHHIVVYNPKTGEVEEIKYGQGFEVGSSWSRGQAWGIYGFTLSYLHTHEERYLNAAKKIANYFIAACCDDYLPRSDFRAPKEPVLYDSSAGLAAACGLIELSKVVGEYERDMYYNAAQRLIKAIVDNFADWSEDSDAIITHCSEHYHAMQQLTLIYADFFLVEAMSKLKGFDTFMW